ncbi:Lrp/AsnC family transcriptional regulator [Anoxynatronum buryatiense]|uniref:siroheme decarboxylase n=1 Tax=Anoxynatronum buryatiense TaxID=489973 RepID=A0AA45WWI8_9CLOT|nr:AsnC family transcriptional regulator [Anoxynatronum buryatiense]SMP54292.1 transcriptional regulator, AsnC family [Anoxynatronum buryatiense]
MNAIQDPIDQQLLNLIQRDFPVASRPYQVLGDALGISESQAFQRVNRLRETGVIRRLGGVFDSRKLGYVSTLCAVSVPDHLIPQAAALINPLPGVTHHYQRDHAYNLWFTLIAPSDAKLSETLEQLEKDLRVQADAGSLLNLPACQTFKIKVQFQL